MDHCCGSLRAEVTGERAFVAIWSATAVLARFGVATNFPKAQVLTDGPNKVYVCDSDSGQKIEGWSLRRSYQRVRKQIALSDCRYIE